MSQEKQPTEDRSLHAGDDLEFEKAWWRIETGIWIFLILLIGTAATGLLGRGRWAKEKISSPDGRLMVNYDRVSRFKTPSATIVRIVPERSDADEVTLWVNDTMMKHLGLSTIVPQPDEAVPGPDGVTYKWEIEKGTPSFEARFDLQPDQPGMFHEEFRTDTSRVKMRSVTLP